METSAPTIGAWKTLVWDTWHTRRHTQDATTIRITRTFKTLKNHTYHAKLAIRFTLTLKTWKRRLSIMETLKPAIRAWKKFVRHTRYTNNDVANQTRIENYEKAYLKREKLWFRPDQNVENIWTAHAIHKRVVFAINTFFFCYQSES